MSFSRPPVVCSVITVALLSAQVAPGPQALEQRIQRIQDGLLPAVLMKGGPVQTTKLADRMAALHVPGVSIAVIHDGAIEWARGFGVTSLGTNKTGGPAVTPETL